MQIVLECGQCRDDHRLLEGECRPRESQDRQRDVVVLPTLSHLASLATGACQDRATLVALKFANLALRFALELCVLAAVAMLAATYVSNRVLIAVLDR